jgi:hypothetical protein
VRQHVVQLLVVNQDVVQVTINVLRHVVRRSVVLLEILERHLLRQLLVVPPNVAQHQKSAQNHVVRQLVAIQIRREERLDYSELSISFNFEFFLSML